MKMIIVRHGHVEGVNPPRFRGRTDLPLTELGQRQAHELAKRICTGERVSAVYSSPLSRCIDTAATLARAVDLEVRPMSQLIDIDYGSYQGMMLSEASSLHPKIMEAWLANPHTVRFPDGESLQDVAARTSDALRLFVDRHHDESIVVVGHDSTNRVLLLDLLGLPLRQYWCISQDPCCLNEVHVDRGNAVVRRLNDSSHIVDDGPFPS